jgi:NAD(P)-dependent dehydrogenase (short-subunit alcohol dehydrogenase family)
MAGWAIYPSLEGKSVFITGGGSGIGAAMTEHFCTQKSKVAFCDLDEQASGALIESLRGRGLGQPKFLKCDVRDIGQLQATIAAAGQANGPITVLINNAARDDRHAFETVTPDYWDERMAVNLKHQFFAAQAVYPMMKQAGGGSIVNFGSTSWMVGQGGMPAYTTAKSAIAGLTRSLARDFGPANIRVNCIAPGWIMTERQKTKWLTPEGEQELLKRQCLKRQLQPAEMARLALFLASEDSSAMTNQTYVADGGWV